MNKKEIRYEFINYLNQNYSYARPDIIASNVFYAYNHDIGMNFWAIFESEDSLLKGKELIQEKFEKISRKAPKTHASISYGCFVKFKKFLDYKYGGAIAANLQFCI